MASSRTVPKAVLRWIRVKPVGFIEQPLPGELKVAMDWRRVIAGPVGIRKWDGDSARGVAG